MTSKSANSTVTVDVEEEQPDVPEPLFKFKTPINGGSLTALEKAIQTIMDDERYSGMFVTRSSFTEKAVYLCAAIEADWFAEPATEARHIIVKGKGSGKDSVRYEFYFDGKEVFSDMDILDISTIGRAVLRIYDGANSPPLA